MSDDRPWHRDAAVVVRTEQRLNPAAARRAAVETEALLRPRSANVKGYVVSGIAPGNVVHTEPRRTVGEAISTRDAMLMAGGSDVTIFAVAEDGTETPVPTYEEALAENGRMRAEVDRWQKSEAECVRAGLEKVGQLKAENDRLRSERDAFEATANMWRTTADGYCNTIAERDVEIDRLRSERDALSAAWARCAAAAVEDRDAQIATDMEQHGGEEWRARTQQEVEAAKGALRALGVDVDAMLRSGT
jgi:hypothetical protein